MRNDCAKDSSPISWEESNQELSVLWVLLLGFCWEWNSVHPSYCFLKGDKLNYCIWNLSTPQRNKSSIHAIPSLILHDLLPCCPELSWELAGLISLHSDLYSFEGTEKSICNDLSTGWRDWPSNCFVFVCILLANNSLVHVFEDFIETEFSKTLSGVPNESWHPTDRQSFESLLGLNRVESIRYWFVNLCINLFSAFNDVKSYNGCVCKSASKDSSSHAFNVVSSIMNVRHVALVLK